MNFTKINEQLQRLKDLLKLEKEEDFERFRREIQQLSIKDKVGKGLCWYPLEVKKEGFSIGERAFVIVERTAGRNEPHRLKSGSPVSFYSRASDKFSTKEKQAQSGVIQYVERNKMKIVLNSKDIPEWLSLGQLGVDLLFDERTYLEMDKALANLIKTNDGRLSELKAIFYGAMKPQFAEKKELHNGLLNEAQINAVQNILASKDVAIIHGPPGTGKTTTLVNAIKLLCQKESTVLVTAPSNAAVDLLTDRLTTANLNVVRIGNISRVEEKLISLTLEGRLSVHPEHKNIKKVRIEAAKARRMAQKHRRKFGAVEREERRDSYRESRALEDWARELEDRLISEILMSADVIACTLVNTTSRLLQNMKFKTVVIDEAAQALEPATWIPISRVEKVVLAGDPFQLPPTVKSIDAKRKGLEITLLEKAIQEVEEVSFLNVQYRMNETIMGFSNNRFYEGALMASEFVAQWKMPEPNNQPIVFIDTAGCGFEEEKNPETLSSFNKGEHFILREHLLKFTSTFPEDQWEHTSIAIISPYRAQCEYIDEEFSNDESLEAYLEHIDINTIDAFQGQERDLIYISLVRSNDKGEIGFLKDYRRMNVAMTRAKKQLVVIGDSATMGNDDFYQAFLEYAETHGQYQSAWEYMG